MKKATVALYFLRNEFIVTGCFVIIALVLLIAPLGSDSWVELRLRRVARCSTKDPFLYELNCRKLRWTDHQVARAGLWVVCYSFPKGIVPQLYFKTKPYCADFDDDIVTAEWLDDARFFCYLSPILATFGLLFYTIGKYTGQIYTEQTGHVLFVFSGMTGVLGPLKMFFHMDKTFLIPERRTRVKLFICSPFYWTVLGSFLMALVGITGHIDKTDYERKPCQCKDV
ncbi:hypothetical protein ElyMa_003882600 [Elysia marginata]|uniref:Uncharacterized protein n=1 Tax=Elysia marginata TaxID=1093978 RepID=A0AAV4FM92_9GAST|nr:hypothetical protein ElyMa_003882600 [Elysia marginata]